VDFIANPFEATNFISKITPHDKCLPGSFIGIGRNWTKEGTTMIVRLGAGWRMRRSSAGILNPVKNLASDNAIARPSLALAVNSNVPSKVAHPALQSLGNFRQRFERNLFLGPLNIADVVSGQVGFLGQLFLTQAGFFSSGAHSCTQSAVNFARI
jgi:hypothetical protein